MRKSEKLLQNSLRFGRLISAESLAKEAQKQTQICIWAEWEPSTFDDWSEIFETVAKLKSIALQRR